MASRKVDAAQATSMLKSGESLNRVARYFACTPGTVRRAVNNTLTRGTIVTAKKINGHAASGPVGRMHAKATGDDALPDDITAGDIELLIDLAKRGAITMGPNDAPVALAFINRIEPMIRDGLL